MLNLDAVAAAPRPGEERDERMTTRSGSWVTPAAGLLGIRAFAVAPWISLAVVAFAYVVAEVLRAGQRPADPELIVGGAALAAGATLLAVLQDRPIGLRYRRVAWVYGVAAGTVLIALAILAVRDTGVTSPIFSVVCPLALWMGMVAPPAWRYRSLGALTAVVVTVDLALPAATRFDAGLVWTLIVASWACGVLVSVGQARTALIIGRMRSVDRESRTLSRRGFMEVLEHLLAPRGQVDDAVALLVVEVDLARVAALDGDGGSGLLHWIGRTVPEVLPEAAEFGRLSDREFAVLVPGIDRDEASALADAVRRILSTRVPAAVGVATSESFAIGGSDLFRVADAARAIAARGSGVHALVAGSLGSTATEAYRPEAVPRPAVHFASLRRTGQLPRAVEEATVNRRIATLGTLAALPVGIAIVLRGILDGGSGFADDLIRYAGPLWLLWGAVSVAAAHRWVTGAGRRIEDLLHLNSALAIGIGVAVTAIATGGLTAPIAAAFFVRALFDASVFGARRSAIGLGVVLVAWGAVAVFGPADALWVAPFHLALLAACFVLGRLGRRAMDDMAALARDRASVDDLTGIATRSAFVEQAEAAFFRSATATGQPFAVITLRIEGLRAFNEQRGYASGDRLLQRVAGLLRERAGVAYAVGRTGSTEFSVAVMAGEHAADGLARDLGEAIGAVVGVRTACAACPRDGATVAALTLAAERMVEAPRTKVI